MKKLRTSILIDRKVHSKYRALCKENGLIMSKRIEDLMRADLEKRLIKIPKVEL